MDTTTVLVVENDPTSLDMIESTLREARIRFVVCSDSAEAWKVFSDNPDISSLVTRMKVDGIDGCELTRQIREVKSHEQFSILMIIPESDLEIASLAIDAGATDVLIDPFEARELRMRMNIQPVWNRRRVDDPHAVTVSNDDLDDVVSREAELPEVASSEVPEVSMTDVRTLIPKFNSESLRFSHDASDVQVDEWMNDPSVTKMHLDELMVCPCCGCLPTFRYGCGSCGCATTKPDSLVHHYACAHIASEAEFQHGSSVRCPKCLKSNLVAGSDFEIVPGGHVCTECHSKVTAPELIGHCLSCQHRFVASDAAIQKLTGLRVTRVHERIKETGQQIRPVKRRNQRQREVHTS